MIIVLHNKVLVTLDLLYYRPQSLLLQRFIWQTMDEPPQHPRIHRFLKYWHDEIDAIIKEAAIIDNYNHNIKYVKSYKDFT